MLVKYIERNFGITTSYRFIQKKIKNKFKKTLTSMVIHANITKFADENITNEILESVNHSEV